MLNHALLFEAERIAGQGHGASPDVANALLKGLSELRKELKLKGSQVGELAERVSTLPKVHVPFPVPYRGDAVLACRCGTMLDLEDMYRGPIGASIRVIPPIQCYECSITKENQ